MRGDGSWRVKLTRCLRLLAAETRGPAGGGALLLRCGGDLSMTGSAGLDVQSAQQQDQIKKKRHMSLGELVVLVLVER
jgi:hypothetical protein